MKKLLFTSLMLIFIGVAANAFSISGKWEGELSLGPNKLPLVFNISQPSATEWSVTLDSPAQGVTGIPCEATVNCDNIEIKIALINATYSGNFAEQEITGTFSQNGFSLPLTLRKVKEVKARQAVNNERAKNDEEIVFHNGNVALAGTLAWPDASSGVSTPYPAVVLITGSGTQDRDETIMGLKPFKIISDYLTQHGVVVLRYDDRGAGKSSPLKGNETSFDFARDAKAAFDYLSNQPNIDMRRIGYIGHSEGGQIAFINAATDPSVAFVVSLAGPAACGRDVMVQQNLSLLDMQGVPYTQTQVDEISAIFDDIVNIADTTMLRESLRKHLAASTLQRYTNEQLEQSVAAMTSPWYMSFIRCNPKPYLEKITCPVLALNGEWDFQVDAKQTFDALKASVKNVRCELLPKHNHLFQECASKIESMNYATQGNISQTTLDHIKEFIKGVYSKQ